MEAVGSWKSDIFSAQLRKWRASIEPLTRQKPWAAVGFMEIRVTSGNIERSRRIGSPIAATLAAVTDRRYRRFRT
jgi:hypothetical protein